MDGRTVEDLIAQNEELRGRIASLESELVLQAARTNAITAEAQERVYWLDRWHLDLNELMRRPGAAQVRWLMRAARQPLRLAKHLKRLIAG